MQVRGVSILKIRRNAKYGTHELPDELRNLHVGQGSELSWTYLSTCPTEADYIKMIDGSQYSIHSLKRLIY